MIKDIIWFDEDVNSPENTDYLKKIKSEFPNFNISTIKKDKELFDKIKNLRFKAYIIIMNGRKFQIFIEYFLKNKKSIPISAIFTSDKALKENYNANYKKYLEDQFYNPLGISVNITDLLNSIKQFLNQLKNEINDIKFGFTREPQDYKDCYSFEYLNNEYQLVFPVLYNKIMSHKEISNEEKKSANKYILEKYGEDIQIKEKIIPLINVNNIPENILAKFWGNIYTMPSNFYKNLNHSLMKKEKTDNEEQKENEEYINSYVQVLYSGLKEFEFTEKKMLYRGARLSNEEFEILNKFYENRKINKEKFEPSYLMYSRAFLSFTKEEDKTLQFLSSGEGTKTILFRLNNILDNEILSNADLKEISDIPEEKEVLFFPFSAFIITNISKKNENIYYIDLEYLGIYKHNIDKCIEEVNNNPDNPELFNKIIRTPFAKDCIQSQIITSKSEKNNTEENLSKSQEIIIKNIFKNNDDNKSKGQESIIRNILKYNNYFMNNEINATYMKNEKKINLLHNYDLTEDLIYEVKESYIEAKKDINSENVEIFVNGKKINFDFYYSSNEIGEIKVKFKFKKLLVNTSYLFYNCSSLKLIDLSSFKTGEIKSMISMFENCSSLESLDLVSFNTSNVQNMSCMFRNCSSLKKINLSLFETNKVKDISYMFMDCSSLNSIDLSSFNTDEVKNMSHIFESCSSLQSINISSFKTKESTNVWNMFEGCSSLKKENIIMDVNDENISKELSYLK